MKSIHFAVRLPQGLADALKKHFQPRAIPDFIRRATAEKLARDFGEKIDVASLKMRVGQGARSDIAEKRARIAELNAKLAPYGGAAEIIKTGNGAAETSDIINELADLRAELVECCPAARKKQAAAKKEYEAAKAARVEIEKIEKAVREKREAKQREAGKYPENGTPEEIAAWCRRSAVLFNLKEFEARQKLETRRKSHWKNFIELNAEAVRLAEAFAAGKGTGTAK